MNQLVFIVAACLSYLTGINAARQINVRAYYPKKVSSLYLRGDECGLNWDKGVQMTVSSFTVASESSSNSTSTTGYVYYAAVSCSENLSKFEVKVLVDDRTWMIGANHHVSIDSTQQTTQMESVYPWFYTSKGSLSTMSKVYSKELGNYRDVIVYTPPSYNENTLKTHKNVLVMHDGQNLFDPRTSAFGTAWMAQDTVDSLIVQGLMDEIVIVGPYNTPDRTNEYTYVYDPSEKTGGKGDLYLDWIESTLLPLSAKTYRVTMDRNHLGILGSSLGGLISCYAGWTRASIYGKVGCMSSSFWWDENDYQNNIIVNSKPDTSKYSALPGFYMDSGTSGGDASCAVYTTEIYEYYQTVGFIDNINLWKYIDQGGSHNEASWGKRFYLPMEALYPATTV
jgi:predicted alpha/beta superfamily hydrolase